MKVLFTSSNGRFVAVWSALTGAGLLLLVSVNAVIDPYWIMGHTNALNRIQPGCDERLQKSNFLAYNDKAAHFDALLLGSSRATYFDVASIEGARVFNYAANNMVPEEYQAYVEHFAKNAGMPRTIYLAVDFFGTRPADYYEYRPPEYYLDSIGGWSRKVALLLSFDSFRTALDIAKVNLAGTASGVGYYDRATRMHADPPFDVAERRQNLERQLEYYRENIYGNGYVYNERIEPALALLKEAWPEVKFVVFTTPPTVELQALLVKEGLLDDYARWLRMLVRTFGRIHDFTGVNDFTSDPANYRDAHHFTPAAGQRILADLAGGQPRIARVVTDTNLEDHLAMQVDDLTKIAGNTGRTSNE